MGEYTPIRNLKPGMKDLTLMFIVLDVGRPNVTKDNHEVRTVKVADKTGAVNLSLWDEPGKLVQSGDIVRMTKGYLNVWKGCLTLYVGKGGEFLKVGDFCLIFSEQPFLSEYNAELAAVMDTRGSQQQPQGGAGGGKPPFGGGGGGRGLGGNGSNSSGSGPSSSSSSGRFNGGSGGQQGGWGSGGGRGGGSSMGRPAKDKTR